MKSKILILLNFLPIAITYGQDVQIRSAVMAPSGINITSEAINISKWRIGQVYHIVLDPNELQTLSVNEIEVSAYPNPTFNIVNLKFQTKENDEYTIQLSDESGKQILFTNDRTIQPDEIIQMDLNKLHPSMYLLTISSNKGQNQKVIKINKL